MSRIVAAIYSLREASHHRGVERDAEEHIDAHQGAAQLTHVAGGAIPSGVCATRYRLKTDNTQVQLRLAQHSSR